MKFATGPEGREQAIIDLYAAAFSSSEGEAEGKLIGDLVRTLLSTTPERDLFVFTAEKDGAIVGSICFSRLSYDQDERTVFILSPVGVAPEYQGKGVGKALLEHGLQALGKLQIEVCVTYGDPKYYSKVGFRQITQRFAQAPFDLKHPEGWLAQSLTDVELTPLHGSSRCVAALNSPVYW